jgi:hypothetical protein
MKKKAKIVLIVLMSSFLLYLILLPYYRSYLRNKHKKVAKAIIVETKPHKNGQTYIDYTFIHNNILYNGTDVFSNNTGVMIHASDTITIIFQENDPENSIPYYDSLQ